MKLSIESTSEVVVLNGVEARAWEGTTQDGQRVRCFVTCVEVPDKPGVDFKPFVDELKEQAAPELDDTEAEQQRYETLCDRLMDAGRAVMGVDFDDLGLTIVVHNKPSSNGGNRAYVGTLLEQDDLRVLICSLMVDLLARLPDASLISCVSDLFSNLQRLAARAAERASDA